MHKCILHNMFVYGAFLSSKPLIIIYVYYQYFVVDCRRPTGILLQVFHYSLLPLMA